MEAATLIKALTALLLAGAGLYLLILRPWRLERLVRGRVPSVDGLFLLALVMGLASLHSGPPFEQVALRMVEYTELPETLMEVDLQIEAIEQWPQQVWSDLMARVGWDDPELRLQPEPPEPGWVTETVLPSVLAVIETILRGFVYWGSLVLMAVCLAVRLAIGLVRSVRNKSGRANEQNLEAEVSRLEEKIAILETKLVD
ncbi:MAG: hypothetical protein ACJZ7Z_05565 [Myxococcota bacterium]